MGDFWPAKERVRPSWRGLLHGAVALCLWKFDVGDVVEPPSGGRS